MKTTMTCRVNDGELKDDDAVAVTMALDNLGNDESETTNLAADQHAQGDLPGAARPV
jgi:hypothetical protein